MSPEKITPLAEYIKKSKGRSDLAVAELKKKRGDYKDLPELKARDKEDILAQIDAAVKSGNDEELDKLQKELEDFDKSGPEIFEEAQSLEAESKWKKQEAVKNTEAEDNKETEKQKIIDKLEAAERMGDQEEIEELSKELEIANKSGTEIFEEAQVLEAGEKARRNNAVKVRRSSGDVEEWDIVNYIGDSVFVTKKMEEGKYLNKRVSLKELAELNPENEYVKKILSESKAETGGELTELKKQLDQARKDYAMMDYKKGALWKKVYSYFGDQIKRGGRKDDSDLTYYEAIYNNKLLDYKNALLQNIKEKGLTGEVLEKELADAIKDIDTDGSVNLYNARMEARGESSNNAALITKGWKRITNEYIKLSGKKKIALAAGLGLGAAGTAALTPFIGTAGIVIGGVFIGANQLRRVLAGSAAAVGAEAGLEKIAEKYRGRKSEKRTKGYLNSQEKLEKLEGLTEEEKINRISKKLNEIVFSAESQLQRRKLGSLFRKTGALSLGVVVGSGVLFSYISEKTGLVDATRDAIGKLSKTAVGQWIMEKFDIDEWLRPENSGPSSHTPADVPEPKAEEIVKPEPSSGSAPEAPLGEDEIRLAENENPPTHTDVPVSEADQIRLAENDNPPVSETATEIPPYKPGPYHDQILEVKGAGSSIESTLIQDLKAHPELIEKYNELRGGERNFDAGQIAHRMVEELRSENPGAFPNSNPDLIHEGAKITYDPNTMKISAIEDNYLHYENVAGPENIPSETPTPEASGSETPNAGLSQEEINKLQDYEDSARENLKTGDAIPETKPESNAGMDNQEPEIKIEKEADLGGKINELIGNSGSLKENVANFRRELFLGNHSEWIVAENMSVESALKDLRADLREKLGTFLDKSREVLGNEAEPLKKPFSPPETLKEWSQRVVRLMMEKRGVEFIKI